MVKYFGYNKAVKCGYGTEFIYWKKTVKKYYVIVF